MSDRNTKILGVFFLLQLGQRQLHFHSALAKIFELLPQYLGEFHT